MDVSILQPDGCFHFAGVASLLLARHDHVLVAFFGDATFGWFTESNLVPFEPTFAHKSKQTMSRSFCDAVDELHRRAGQACCVGFDVWLHKFLQFYSKGGAY